MAKVVKVIELLSESSKSLEDATQGAVNEASKTLRNIRSIYIKEFTAAVKNGNDESKGISNRGQPRAAPPTRGSAGRSAARREADRETCPRTHRRGAGRLPRRFDRNTRSIRPKWRAMELSRPRLAS